MNDYAPVSKQAAGPGEKGGPDLAFSRCVKNEQAMRQKLTGEWSTFIPSEKTNCVGEETSLRRSTANKNLHRTRRVTARSQ
ncbi:MAG: hypothetical protein WBE90_19585 [Xanthobacteraceae bacterium]|jgi:hypothetical protein